MYSLILLVYLSVTGCLGCVGELVSVTTTPGFATLSACQQAGQQVQRTAQTRRLKVQCVRME